MALTGNDTLGEWLDDPVAGRLIGELLARVGADREALGPARVFPLHRLVVLSQGLISQEMVDDLVRSANGGELVSTAVERRNPAGPFQLRQGLALADIQIRDPFLVHDPASREYYLFGSTDPNIWDGPGIGFDTYRSTDLTAWEGPFAAFRPPAGFWAEGQFWAPEVHQYDGHWYMLATFAAPEGYRGTQVLAADSPRGPFMPWSDGPVTPRKWQCLDGTLFVADGQPWIAFCQEWTQIHDGAIWAQRLSQNLRCTTGEPVFLFSASDAPWSRPLRNVRTRFPAYVTDGPFLHRLASGHLVMLWSSHGERGYAMGLAHSETGRITGPWRQQDEPLWPADGGHGMVLRLPDGGLLLTLHQPNDSPDERAVLVHLAEDGTGLRLLDPPPIPCMG